MSSFVTFLTVYALAIISPGPNFVLVFNSALGESREQGLATAFGVATGSLLFALSGLFGLLFILTSWPPVTGVLVYVGGGYLVWVGVNMLAQCRRGHSPLMSGDAPKFAAGAAFRRGLLTNLSNPKAWAFYLSLFTLMVTPELSLWGKLLLALAMFSISFTWYATVVLMMTSGVFRASLSKIQPIIQGVLGGVLLVLGGRLLFSDF